MIMQEATIYQQYKAQALETLTNGEIVVKLFEEVSKQVSMSIFRTTSGNSYRAYNCISKAQKLISALDNSLNMQYAISIELSEMYMFLYHKLPEAAIAKNTGLLKELLKIIDELKVTFRQADRIARAQK
jgi:flagellar protein FliS